MVPLQNSYYIAIHVFCTCKIRHGLVMALCPSPDVFWYREGDEVEELEEGEDVELGNTGDK